VIKSKLFGMVVRINLMIVCSITIIKCNMKKTTKIISLTFGVGLVIAIAVAYYMFNMPKRDVQSAKTDFSVSSTDIVNEYLADAALANGKYLQEEGDSKILAVTGTVVSINEDLNNQKVILLKNPGDKAGVSCTFTAETNKHTENLQIGETVTVKGVIRSGAGFDVDLDFYEDVIMEKCDIVLK